MSINNTCKGQKTLAGKELLKKKINRSHNIYIFQTLQLHKLAYCIYYNAATCVLIWIHNLHTGSQDQLDKG